MKSAIVVLPPPLSPRIMFTPAWKPSLNTERPPFTTTSLSSLSDGSSRVIPEFHQSGSIFQPVTPSELNGAKPVDYKVNEIITQRVCRVGGGGEPARGVVIEVEPQDSTLVRVSIQNL